MIAQRLCRHPKTSWSQQRNLATMQSRCCRRRGVATAQALLHHCRGLSRWARRLPEQPRGRRHRRRSSASPLPRRTLEVASDLVELCDDQHVCYHSAAIANLTPHPMQATRLGRRL